jgi:hypothetical protein
VGVAVFAGVAEAGFAVGVNIAVAVGGVGGAVPQLVSHNKKRTSKPINLFESIITLSFGK